MIAYSIPKKNTWSIEATKDEYCDWVFDIKPFVKDEALTNGTNTIIDTYFLQIVGHPADVGDKINITVSTKKPSFYHAECTNFAPEPFNGFGHVYVETQTQMVGWFCPMFEIMFGHLPKSVWVTFQSDEADENNFIKFVTGKDINSI